MSTTNQTKKKRKEKKRKKRKELKKKSAMKVSDISLYFLASSNLKEEVANSFEAND